MQKGTALISTIIITEKGEVPDKNVKAALSISEVCLLHPPEISPAASASVKHISAMPSAPAACNRIAAECGTEFLIIIADDVKLDVNLPELLQNIPKAAGLIYGDYLELAGAELAVKRTYQGPEDITERAELGPAMIYRVEAIKKAGGWNESLKYAYDYDLRLRLGEIGRFQHIDSAVCTVQPASVIDGEADKLFFPGKGKYGGFSYLFMEPEEEHEIEAVFLNSLNRRGAFLEGGAPPMKPKPLTSPAVSVITPVYNREKFIGKAIESVLIGKFQDFEYIIIDNGSTDRTVEVVESYTSDPRIKLIRNDVNRIAISLNIGLKEARGKYISQLDSDDLYTPDTLNNMTAFMEETNCALGISYYSLIDEAGNDLPEFGIVKHEEYSRNNILRVDGAGAVRIWRKSAILEFGGFDEGELCDYGEDYDLVLKVGEKYRVGRVREVLYKYRRHPDNSDIKRDPLFKLRNKNLARERALGRRSVMNIQKRR